MKLKEIVLVFKLFLLFFSSNSYGQDLSSQKSAVTFNQVLYFLLNELKGPTIEFQGYEVLSLARESRCYRFSFLKAIEYDRKIDFVVYLESDVNDQVLAIAIPDVPYLAINSKFLNLEPVFKSNVDGLNFRLGLLRGKMQENFMRSISLTAKCEHL